MDKNIGKKLDGRYEIQEIIGVGGMAIVYKAYDSIEDRTVAIKILKDEFVQNDEFRHRFRNESRAIAVLSHPNIVKIYDVSFSDKLQYIVMEYIDGITLKEYIDQQKVLKWKEAVHFTEQILRALEHAHEKGIVHRDIKPQNIMLLRDGTIKVMDFGIARFANSETRTMTEKAIGSVHYISPEQARGEATDDKSDLYSVGVMLFEMLTGELPFEADSAVSVAIMQMQSNPKRPRELNPDIPEGLEDIVLRAMQKDPSQRYQTAGEMLEDIEKFKQNPSIHFEYKYFVDEDPTKYVNAIDEIRGNEEEPEQEEEEEKKPPFIPILAGIAGGLVLLAALAVVLYLFMSGVIGPKGGNVTLTNFVGQNYKTVEANNKNLTFTVTTEFSDKYAANLIIEQKPAAGITVKTGSAVAIVVSKGHTQVKVPSVAGMDQNTAKSTLEQQGFTVQITFWTDPNTQPGYVSYTDPMANTMANYGSQVVMFVSSGTSSTSTVQVPNLVGLSLDDAKNKIQQAGLSLGNVTGTPNSAPKNQVLKQSVNAGQTVAKGQSVDLTYSTGLSDVNMTMSLPFSSAVYTVSINVDGHSYTNTAANYQVPFTTTGGSSVAVTIQGGKYSGTHNVQILVSGGDNGYNNKLYAEVKVNFDTGSVVSTVQDNSGSFTRQETSSAADAASGTETASKSGTH